MRAGIGILGATPLAEGDPLPPQSDRAVWTASRLELIYRSERSRLLNFVKGKTGRDDIEDIVQRSFTRLAERQNVEDLVRPGAYLRQTAHNILVDDARSAARSPASCHASVDELPLADGDPVAALEARDRLRRIEDAVSRLKPLTRQIFLACRVDGYTHSQIAQQTGLSIKGVEKQMCKALKQLGRHLRQND